MTPTTDWTTIALALIAGVVTLAGPVIAFYLASVSAKQTKVLESNQQVVTGQARAFEQGELIHRTVNSGQTAMLKEQERLNVEVLRLSSELATAAEALRGQTIQSVKDEERATREKVEAAKETGILEGKQIAADSVGISTPNVIISAPPDAPTVSQEPPPSTHK